MQIGDDGAAVSQIRPILVRTAGLPAQLAEEREHPRGAALPRSEYKSRLVEH
jgi:hypothetical protein